MARHTRPPTRRFTASTLARRRPVLIPALVLFIPQAAVLGVVLIAIYRAEISTRRTEVEAAAGASTENHARRQE